MTNSQPRCFLLSALLAVISTGCSAPDAEPEINYQVVPAGSNARSPNLAEFGNSSAVLSWIETAGEGHALRFSRIVDDAWSEPVTVAEGSDWFVNWADFPSVVPVSDVLWGAHWLVSQPDGGFAYDVNFSMSVDSGATWSDPVIPHTDATATEHGFVSMYPHDGGIGLVWLDGRNMVNEYDPDVIRDGMTLRSAVFAADGTVTLEQEVDGLICDCCQTDVTMTASGPLAAYRNRTEQEIRDIYLARALDGAWQAGQPLADDNWEIAACPVNGPVLSSSGKNTVAAWFTGTGGISHVRMAFSGDGGQSFASPIEVVTGDVFGHVGVILLDNGEAVVSWLRKTGDYDAELMLARVAQDGSVGPAITVGQEEPISGYSVPQLARSGEDLLVAWTAGSYEDSNVRTALVPLSLIK